MTTTIQMRDRLGKRLADHSTRLAFIADCEDAVFEAMFPESTRAEATSAECRAAYYTARMLLGTFDAYYDPNYDPFDETTEVPA